MNIGILCYPTFGGSGVVATELGIALAKKGHKVHFISYAQPFRLNEFNDNIFFHEVSVSNYPLFEYQPIESALTSKIVDVVLFEKLDLLHVHYAIPHASVAYMSQQILKTKNVYLPFITTLHGTDITLIGQHPSFETIINFSLQQSNKITAVSESLKNETLKMFNLNKHIEVIPNFINISDYPLNTDKLNSDGSKTLIHISNFRKVKRIDDVIAVFYKVQQKITSKLILIGDGPERDNAEKLCRDLNIMNKVVFLGKLINPINMLSRADLFLLPSETESFGLAALESLAMGVPVISSNTGGIPEVNINGLTGYTCNVGDINEMANKAIYLLGNNIHQEKFKKNAIEHSKKFDINVVLPLYEKLYSEVLQNTN